ERDGVGEVDPARVVGIESVEAGSPSASRTPIEEEVAEDADGVREVEGPGSIRVAPEEALGRAEVSLPRPKLRFELGERHAAEAGALLGEFIEKPPLLRRERDRRRLALRGVA